MTTTQEALKMAIEAMETVNVFHNPAFLKEAINACKEALEQQEQEPVAWMAMDLHTSWLTFQKEAVKDAKEIIPLYTHPAKQLSDDEIIKLSHEYDMYHYLGIIDFARAIEAAIRGE